MKLFNNHSGSRGLPRFIKGIYWATGLFLRTPFTEGCAGANKKASPPGRHQEQASKQRCTFSPTTFSSVQRWGGGGFIQFSSVHGRRPQILLFKHLEINRPSRLGQPPPAMTGNGAGSPNFAPIDLKPRIWTFQTRCYRPPAVPQARNIRSKRLFLFFGFVPILLPHGLNGGFSRVNFFSHFFSVGQLPAQQIPDKRFLTKVPHFFL